MARIEKPIGAVAGATLLLWLSAPAVMAEGRPSEDALFGAPDSQPSADAPPPVSDASAPSQEQGEVPGETPDEPFQVGGVIYQRLIASRQKGLSWSDSSQSRPLQVDAFMDARPNDRVRAFVNTRWLYDSTRDENSVPKRRNSLGGLQNASTPNPDTVLDQAWLKFDVARTVFVTVGRQHVKWGASRYWNPTDFINTEKRDSLATYDLRRGRVMTKFAIPWEATQTNFYAIALHDSFEPGNAPDRTGGAFRAETVWGSAEIGIDAVTRADRAPVYGMDISTALGPFDAYAEVALLTGTTTDYRVIGAPAPAADIAGLYETRTRKGPFVQFSTGANYTFGWQENRQATAGVEYFHNPLGYDDPSDYPVLLFLGQFQPLYVGKRYAAIYLSAEGLDSQKHTAYTFSTLANLSDKSYLSRIGFSWQVRTFLSFESYLQYHHGTRGGEFNFSMNTPPMTYFGVPVAAIDVAPTVYDIGLSGRFSF